MFHRFHRVQHPASGVRFSRKGGWSWFFWRKDNVFVQDPGDIVSLSVFGMFLWSWFVARHEGCRLKASDGVTATVSPFVSSKASLTMPAHNLGPEPLYTLSSPGWWHMVQLALWCHDGGLSVSGYCNGENFNAYGVLLSLRSITICHKLSCWCLEEESFNFALNDSGGFI